MNFTANYTKVNENLAKQAKEMNSFRDYRQGSTTEKQKYYVDCIVEFSNEVLQKNPTNEVEKLEKVQSYIDRYSVKIAEAIDKENQIRTRCPSILITGAGNFPVARKEKQNKASEAHYLATRDLYKTDTANYYYKKIKLVLTDSGVIKSDDKNAVEKIKAKIQTLETTPDPYGNKKAEIRRLKERLLVLSPDEVKAGKEITINGLAATFENIVKLFDDNTKKLQVWERENETTKYYLAIPLCFYDGKRNYKEYLQNEVNADCTELSTYGNSENNYQTIWKPLNDIMKFNLIIGQIRGSGNKAVIYSILKDLDPTIQTEQSKAVGADQSGTETTINGEKARAESNTELMRLQIFFEGKPEAETRNILKSNGFKWAPSQQAWQRLLNDNAKRALENIIDKV